MDDQKNKPTEEEAPKVISDKRHFRMVNGEVVDLSTPSGALALAPELEAVVDENKELKNQDPTLRALASLEESLSILREKVLQHDGLLALQGSHVLFLIGCVRALVDHSIIKEEQMQLIKEASIHLFPNKEQAEGFWKVIELVTKSFAVPQEDLLKWYPIVQEHGLKVLGVDLTFVPPGSAEERYHREGVQTWDGKSPITAPAAPRRFRRPR